MTTWILIGVITLLTVMLGVSCFFLWKFVTIIMIFEDDIDETLEALGDVESAISSVLDMSLFYDSPEIRKTVQGVLDEVALCRSVVNKVIRKFIKRSKQKYVLTVWDKMPDEEYQQQQQQQQEFPRLPGQPPGSPNPLETIGYEGVILDVRHPKR